MNTIARLATLPLATLFLSMAPAAKVIRHPDSPSLTLFIPSGSPVKFRGWKDGYAHFDGQFVLTGKYALRVTENCAVGMSCLVLDIEPDAVIAARLPRWHNGGDMYITITGEERLVQTIAGPRQRAALLTGKIRPLSGRTAIVVDSFSTGVECEGDYFTARFVAIAKAPKLARTDFSGGFGCAA